MKIYTLALIACLSGCALTPEQIKTTSSSILCDNYSAPLNPMFMHPDLKNELDKRGVTHCTTREYVQARAAALQGLGNSLQLLQAGQRTYAPAAPLPTMPQPVRFTTLLLDNINRFVINIINLKKQNSKSFCSN